MKKVFKKIGIAIIIIFISYFFYWLFWGRILVVNIGEKKIDQILNLDYFELLHPDMSRTEISEKMGQPTKIDVPYVEKNRGEIEYAEVRWIYERTEGQLNYYVEEEDIPGGSVEYVPKSMTLDKFFLNPPKSLFGKYFIEIESNESKLITVKINGDNKIKKINWFYQN